MWFESYFSTRCLIQCRRCSRNELRPKMDASVVLGPLSALHTISVHIFLQGSHNLRCEFTRESMFSRIYLYTAVGTQGFKLSCHFSLLCRDPKIAPLRLVTEQCIVSVISIFQIQMPVVWRGWASDQPGFIKDLDNFLRQRSLLNILEVAL